MRAVIGKDGVPRDVSAVKGHTALRQSAVEAVRQWQYQPYTCAGEPLEAEIEITVNFTGG